MNRKKCIQILSCITLQTGSKFSISLLPISKLMQIKETGLIDFVNSMLFQYHMVYHVYDTGMLLLVKFSSYRLSTLEVYLNNILHLLSQEGNQLIFQY